MLLAQLTDFHVRPKGKLVSNHIDTNSMVETAIDQVLRLSPKPDAVLISGDLTDCGLAEEYEILADQLSRLPMPIYAIPGNHDRREQFAKGLNGIIQPSAMDDFFQYMIDLGPLRLIALDTVVPGEGYGDLCGRRLAWLDAAIDEATDRRVLIMMHHPPGQTGIQFMDEIGLRATDRVAPILERHPRVERIVCGHVHRAIYYRWANTVVSIAPGVAHHVALELENGPPGYTLEPPAFHLHLFDESQGLITHQVPIGSSWISRPFAANPDYPGSESALASQSR